jgi:glycosyltransferase involved in cell wall biosynthesis
LLKICMVAYTHYERDSRVRREAESLIEAGHQVDFIVLKGEKGIREDYLNGVHLYHAPFARMRGGEPVYILGYAAFFVLSFFWLSFLHIKKHYDLVHVNNMPDFLVFAALLPKLAGKPIILDVHDPMLELLLSMFPKNKILEYLLAIEESASFKFANDVITVNEGMKKLMLNKGLNPEHLHVVHNFPDRKLFVQTDTKRKGNRFFTVVFAGTVALRNELHCAIYAVSILKKEFSNLRLRIVGGGPDLTRLRKMVQSLELEREVKFQNWVPLEKLPALLAECNVGLAPYANDAFGNLVFPEKALDALLAGIPVLCSRLTTFEKYFDDSMMFYYEPGNAQSLAEQIRIVYSYPSIVEQKRKNCEKVLSTMTWGHEKQKYLDIIDKFLD